MKLKNSIVILFLTMCSILHSQESKLPTSFSNLNNFAPLVYNLKDNVNFQPLHIEIGEKASFTIIGKFKGYKKNKSVYNLQQIDFAFYEATKFQKPIIVKKAWVEKTNNNITIINIVLQDLSECSSYNCKRKRKQKFNGFVDFKLKLKNTSIKNGSNIDFHIVNFDEIFTKKNTDQNPKSFFPRGRHCNGLTTF